MSTTPSGPGGVVPSAPHPQTSDHDPAPKKSSRGKIVAIVGGAVAALLIAAAIGRASAASHTVAPVAAPAPVTVTAMPSTVTATVTSTPAPVTAAPITVTAAPSTVVQTQTATVTAQALAGPKATIKEGISLVGVDVQPGTYRSDNPSCYFARLSGTSGELDDIIANGNGATVVTIDPSDNAFESRRCSPWTQVG